MDVRISVNSAAPINVTVDRGGERGLTGTGVDVFDVEDYGAVGDGTTDDSGAFQEAIDALETAQRGVLYAHPKTYRLDTGIVFDPSNLIAPSAVRWEGATLYAPNITGDVLTVESNITAVDDQDAEKSYKFHGTHIKGSSSADSGIRNKSTFATFYDTVLEDFTSVTSQQAALVLDALFLEWVEECHFINLDIKNTGNGICFISREDSGGAAASLMNNYFTNVHIWCKVANGKGIYGVGLGASTTANIGRNVFNGVVVHPFEVNGVTAFDFTDCYIEGTVLISPSIDVYGSPTTITAFDYNNSEALTLISPTGHPIAEIDTYYAGGGKYNILGSGNFGYQNYFDKDLDDMDDITDGATYKKYSQTEKTKLAGIEALADVTDAANVDAAGAVMNSDTSTAAMQFVIDEDNMASDSATKVPTQQSVKAYVISVRDALLASAPGALDTLDELAAALGDDASFATTVTNALAAKQPLDSDLTTIAGLTATSDNFMQAKSNAWASRTVAQVKADLKVATKEFWVNPDSASASISGYGDTGVFGLGTTGECFIRFAIPADFAALTSIEIIGIPDATESFQYDLDIDYAAVGETFGTHTSQSLNATKATTLNTLWAIDIAASFGSVAAGDIVGIKFQSDTDFVYVTGCRVKYTT